MKNCPVVVGRKKFPHRKKGSCEKFPLSKGGDGEATAVA